MKTVTTSSGFTAELDETRLNDMELFEDLMALDSGKTIVLPAVVGRIMGENKKRLYDHLRAENGTVPIEKVTAEVMEIITLLGAKNS